MQPVGHTQQNHMLWLQQTRHTSGTTCSPPPPHPPAGPHTVARSGHGYMLQHYWLVVRGGAVYGERLLASSGGGVKVPESSVMAPPPAGASYRLHNTHRIPVFPPRHALEFIPLLRSPACLHVRQSCAAPGHRRVLCSTTMRAGRRAWGGGADGEVKPGPRSCCPGGKTAAAPLGLRATGVELGSVFIGVLPKRREGVSFRGSTRNIPICREPFSIPLKSRQVALSALSG